MSCPAASTGATAAPRARGSAFLRGLCLLAVCAGAFFAVSLEASAQNLIANPGFENNPPPNNGNNIGWSFAPWVLGAGDQSNVVKVDGPGGFNYGNSGPQSDASNNGAGAGSGVPQHYADIVGSNDFYQAFTVPLCGGAPGQTLTAAYSGWFSTRDNLAGTGAVLLRSGVGAGGPILAQQSVSLPVPPAGSALQPWVRVSGAVSVTAGSQVSFVVDMSNNVNFDEASLTFDSPACVSAPLTLRKTWAGAVVNDRAVITATRNGSVVDSLTSDANTANETDTDPTPLTVFQGETIVLAETLPGTNVGAYSTTLSCTGGGTLSGDTLTVGASGTPIVCTYTNERRPRLTVTKVSNGGVGTFAFSGTNGFAAQNITTITSGTGVAGATQTLTAASVSTTITEGAPPTGFILSAIQCTGLGTGGNATYTVDGSGGGNVVLDALATAPGSNIACTFTNTAVGSITIVKDAVPDHAQDFAFTSSQLAIGDFSLDDDADGTLPNTRTFANLTTGSYPVVESAVAGWTLTGLTCTDPDAGSTTSTATRTATIDLDAGEAITCTFVNSATGIADLQITKTNSAATVTSGATTTYTIEVSNGGPAAVTNAVVRDSASSGLSSCAVVTAPTHCTVTSGTATCPTAASLTYANLSSAGGVQIPSMAANSSLQFQVSCTVQ